VIRGYEYRSPGTVAPHRYLRVVKIIRRRVEWAAYERAMRGEA